MLELKARDATASMVRQLIAEQQPELARRRAAIAHAKEESGLLFAAGEDDTGLVAAAIAKVVLIEGRCAGLEMWAKRLEFVDIEKQIDAAEAKLKPLDVAAAQCDLALRNARHTSDTQPVPASGPILSFAEVYDGLRRKVDAAENERYHVRAALQELRAARERMRSDNPDLFD